MKEPQWIKLSTIIIFHDVLLSDDGGLADIRDENLLESAIMSPNQLYHYSNPKPSIIELGARYAYSLVKNHPFNDANKRTAFTVMRVFLKRNGIDLIASEEESYLIMIDLAASVVGEKQFIEWLKLNTKSINSEDKEPVF